jgi:hypothetical protein
MKVVHGSKSITVELANPCLSTCAISHRWPRRRAGSFCRSDRRRPAVPTPDTMRSCLMPRTCAWLRPSQAIGPCGSRARTGTL